MNALDCVGAATTIQSFVGTPGQVWHISESWHMMSGTTSNRQRKLEGNCTVCAKQRL